MKISDEVATIKRVLGRVRQGYRRSALRLEPYDPAKGAYFIKIAQIAGDGSYHGPMRLQVSEEVWKSRELEELIENGKYA